MGAWDPPDSHDRDHHDSWFDYDFDGDGKITPEDDFVGFAIYREAQRHRPAGERETDTADVVGCLIAVLGVIVFFIVSGLRGRAA